MHESRSRRVTRAGAATALGAIVASGLVVAAPADAADATVTVTNADIRPDESVYAGWHQGYDSARYRSAVTTRGLESIGKSQIIRGFADNDDEGLASDGVNADLSDDLVGTSYEVTDGAASFQVPIFADLDGAGEGSAVFTTLRPAVAATGDTTVDESDAWVSSKALGDIAANTPTALSDIIDAVEAGTYKTIAFGVQTESGHSTVESIDFAGTRYVFSEPTSTATVGDADVKDEETSSTYTSWHQGYADATKRHQVTADGLELAGRSQVVKGFNNNSANVKTPNVNLTFGIPEASYTVVEGTAFFQVPVFFDNGSGVTFATLRNTGKGVGEHDLVLTDTWQSSKAVGAIPANTDASLADIVDALGSYKVIGYGVLTNAGDTATVSRISFGGVTTTFADAPGAATEKIVVPSAVAPDESTYAGWHQGAEPATPASVKDGALNLGPDRSQVIRGYSNNSNDINSRNVDLAEALRTGSYTVTSGDAYFQVPMFFEDSEGDVRFTTLRPATKAVEGKNTFSIGDRWVASRAIGSLPANEPALLGDLLSGLRGYKVLGFGVYSDAGGNGVVSNVTWDGVSYAFDKVASKTVVTRINPTRPTSKHRIYVYATITAGDESVAGGKVRVRNGGKTIGTGTVNSAGKVKIHLTKRLAKGKRTLTVLFDGTTDTKASTGTYVVRISK